MNNELYTFEMEPQELPDRKTDESLEMHAVNTAFIKKRIAVLQPCCHSESNRGVGSISVNCREWHLAF
jgi:hypothetical protein